MLDDVAYKRCLEVSQNAYWQETQGGKYLGSRMCLFEGSCIEVGETSFDFEKILFYELARLPPSLFDKENVLRAVKHKLNLMKSLKVEFTKLFFIHL